MKVMTRWGPRPNKEAVNEREKLNGRLDRVRRILMLIIGAD